MEQNRLKFAWIFKVLMLGISCFLFVETVNLLIGLPPKLVISAEAWIAWFVFMEICGLIVIYSLNSQFISSISVAIGTSIIIFGILNLTGTIDLGILFGIQSLLAGFWTVTAAIVGERIKLSLQQEEEGVLA